MPRPVSQEESKTIQLSILQHFHDFCKRHQLRYYLAYGTLLGAVRHKGYIPWDDDIDLMMPRPDYLKFIDLFSQSDQRHYKAQSIQNNPDYFGTFGKIYDTRTIMYQEYGLVEKVEIGVYVDIFPMDGLPEDEDDHKALYKRTSSWTEAYLLSIRKFSAKSSNPLKWLIKTLCSIPCRLIGSHFFISKLEEIAMERRYDESTKVACVSSDRDIERWVNREHLEQSVLLEFEGGHYPAPSDYDGFLTRLYGDYMTVPPEDQRQQHYYSVFWKEDSEPAQLAETS